MNEILLISIIIISVLVLGSVLFFTTRKKDNFGSSAPTPTPTNWMTDGGFLAWLNKSGYGLDFLNTTGGHNFLNFLNNQSGHNLSNLAEQKWLTTPPGQKWLSGGYGQLWLNATLSGQKWLNTADGRKWLNTADGQKWLLLMVRNGKY